MAQITICDICRSDKDVELIRFIIGTNFNGVDYDDDTRLFDLCEKCQLKMYKIFFKKFKSQHNYNDLYALNTTFLNIIENMEK